MIKHHKTFSWLKTATQIEDRINSFAEEWKGTPWVEGQRARKIAADCVQITMAFLDEMFQVKEPTQVPSLPAKVAVNRPELAIPTLNAFKNSHFGFLSIDNDTIEPGDLVVVRAEISRRAAPLEGHVVIALPSPYTVFSISRGARAQRVTLACFTGVLSVYRAKEKIRWALPPL